MSEGLAVDFVVRRKRKRRALESSPGFYGFSDTVSTGLARPQLPAHLPWNVNLLCPTPAPATMESLNQLLGPSTCMEVSPYRDEHLSKGSCTPPHIVTIEEFLRRPAQLLKPIKKVRYGRHNVRALNRAQIAAVTTIDNSELEDDNDDVIQLRSRRIIKRQHYEAEPDMDTAYSSLEKKNLISRNKKKVKSLAERLFSAAVLSNGDPINTLVQPCCDSSRQPLRFIPDNEYVSTTKKRSCSLVDPRRAVPACPISFLRSNGRSIGNSRPLTQTLQLQKNAASLKGDKLLLTRLNVPTTARLPLSFVPMTEAEVSNKNRRVLQDTITMGTSKLTHVQGAARVSRPLTLHGPEQTAPLTNWCTVTPAPRPATPLASSSSTALHENPSCSSLSSPLQNSSPLPSSIHSSSSPLNNACSLHNYTVSSVPCSDRPLPDNSLLTNPERKETPRTKTLRPLASLLDQLRETARDVEIQASYKNKRNLKPSQVDLLNKKELLVKRNISATSIKSIKPFIRASVRGLNFTTSKTVQYNLTTHSQSFVRPSQASNGPISHTYPPLPLPYSSPNSCQPYGNNDTLQWNPLSSPLEDVQQDLDLVNDLKKIRHSPNRQSSPDILSVLAPHPYQVVLRSRSSVPIHLKN